MSQFANVRDTITIDNYHLGHNVDKELIQDTQQTGVNVTSVKNTAVLVINTSLRSIP